MIFCLRHALQGHLMLVGNGDHLSTTIIQSLLLTGDVTAGSPRITVIYLTKNGGPDFLRSLKALRQQDPIMPHEVLVIDSGSTDGTILAAEEFGARIIRIPPQSFNYGGTKNIAVTEAKGDLIVFLSQDNIPSRPDWLERLAGPFSEGANLVQGPAISESSGYYWWREGGFFYTRETRRWLREFGIGLSSCNLAARRDLLEAVPFRAVPMSEDKVLQRDMIKVGISVQAAVDAPVLHTHVYGPRDLALRLENEGLGWRYAGARYTLGDMFKDIFSRGMWYRVARGILLRQISRPHEILFPILRPIMVFKGMHFSKAYRWERDSV